MIIQYTYVNIFSYHIKYFLTCPEVDDIIENNFDVVIADFSITVERLDIIDFSVPIATEGLTIFMRTPKATDGTLFSFLLPYSSTVWFSLLAALVIGKNNKKETKGASILLVSLCVVVMMKLKKSDRHPSLGLWFCVASMFGQGVEGIPW